MNVSENVCSVCKTANALDATFCVKCGASLSDSSTDGGFETKTTGVQSLTPDMISAWSFKEAIAPDPPESGIAVYIDGESSPAYVDSTGSFVLGRKAGTTEGMLVDLAPFRGYSLGLSRRHVIIRRMTDGYEVMDLGSVNGTWLNEERLAPHKSYRLPSGSHLRLGRMNVVVLYRPFAPTP
jgi:hypothetical protein